MSEIKVDVTPTSEESERGYFMRRVLLPGEEAMIALYDPQGYWLTYINTDRNDLEGLKKSIDVILAENL